MRRAPTLTLPATGEDAAALLPAGLEMSPARKIGAEFLPPRRQGNCMRGSPTPSPLRGATSPPPEGEERSPVWQARAFPLPRRSGERWSAKPTGVGVVPPAIAPPQGRERCRVPTAGFVTPPRSVPAECPLGQGGGTRVLRRLPAVDLPAVASDGMPSFAKLRAGEKDRQEISPPYLHLVACAPHRPRGVGVRGRRAILAR